MSAVRPGLPLLMASVAAILPLAVLALPAAGAPLAATEGFALPPGPLLLTRTLHRPLAGGREVVTSRTYRISIVADGPGFRVEGEQIECSVSAPPGLEALATIERNRVDRGLFPFRLNRNGMIMAAEQNGSVTQAAEQAAIPLEQAHKVAAGLLSRSHLPPASKRQAAQALSGLQRRPGGISPWPVDLFNPAPGRHTASQAMTLPDGSQGHFTITIEASGRPELGQHTIDRTIVTEQAGAQQVTHERFLIAMARR